MTAPQKYPWLATYPSDLPHSLEPSRSNMLSIWRSAADAAHDREVIRYFDASLTYAEVDELSDALACWFADAGVRRDERVGIILQNTPHSVIAVLAAWKLGAIPVPGNPMYQEGELAKLFADYEPAVVVCHDDHAATVQAGLSAIGAKAPLVLAAARDFQSQGDRFLPPASPGAAAFGESLVDICRNRKGAKPPAVELNGEDLGLILYTSGTTGRPKGAMISHASLAFVVETSLFWTRLHPGSRILALAPIFHITGFVLHLSIAFAAQCSMALFYRFQPDLVLDVLRSYRPTFTVAAITAFNALMNAPGVSAADFESFESVFTGGAPVAPALREAVKERLGITLYSAYGMTETCSPTHFGPIGLEPPIDAGTGALAVGVPISSTEAKIVDAEGNELPPGRQGEIWMRGPQIMRGYWRKPEETEKSLSDGWMHSGDIGCMDERGWFYVVDRQKDMISASGFKVWPREVEDVLVEHEAVREAAVVGAPDAYRGETVVAYVSTKPGRTVTEADIIAHCRAKLAAYKAPRKVMVLDELPKTLTGKIQRVLLREEAARLAQPEPAPE